MRCLLPGLHKQDEGDLGVVGLNPAVPTPWVMKENSAVHAPGGLWASLNLVPSLEKA